MMDSKIEIYCEQHTQCRSMEDFKSSKLEFLTQQEKQRKEDLKQHEIQRQEDLKRLYGSNERQEESFEKIIECLIKQNDSEISKKFSQESVINSLGEFIYKPEEVTLRGYILCCLNEE